MNWGVFGGWRTRLAWSVAPKFQIYVQFQLAFTGHNGNILSTFFISSTRKLEVIVSGGSTFARVKLKEIDGMAPQDVERAV